MEEVHVAGGNVGVSFSRHAAGASVVLREWLRDCSDTRPTFRAEDLSAEEVTAFGLLLRSVDTDDVACDTTFLKERMEQLVRPLHKYNCPGFWKRLVCTLRAHPHLPTMMKIDSIEALHPDQWMTIEMADHLAARMADGPSASGSAPPSDRLLACAMRLQLRNGKKKGCDSNK
jgi:hypothetical protein